MIDKQSMIMIKEKRNNPKSIKKGQKLIKKREMGIKLDVLIYKML